MDGEKSRQENIRNGKKSRCEKMEDLEQSRQEREGKEREADKNKSARERKKNEKRNGMESNLKSRQEKTREKPSTKIYDNVVKKGNFVDCAKIQIYRILSGKCKCIATPVGKVVSDGPGER